MPIKFNGYKIKKGRFICRPFFNGILRIIHKYYFVAIFVRVIENKRSDTSSLDYQPLRLCAFIYDVVLLDYAIFRIYSARHCEWVDRCVFADYCTGAEDCAAPDLDTVTEYRTKLA